MYNTQKLLMNHGKIRTTTIYITPYDRLQFSINAIECLQKPMCLTQHVVSLKTFDAVPVKTVKTKLSLRYKKGVSPLRLILGYLVKNTTFLVLEARLEDNRRVSRKHLY